MAMIRLLIFMVILIDIITVCSLVYLSLIGENIKIIIQLSFFIIIINSIIWSCLCITNYYKDIDNMKVDLLLFIDNNDDIIIINEKINEYISIDLSQDNRIEFIKILENDLNTNRRQLLLLSMLNRLKNISPPITEERLREELEKTNIEYSNYKSNLERKINAIIQHQTANIIISIF